MSDITMPKSSGEDNCSFEIISEGRSGKILYHKKDRSLSLYWEMSGVKEMDLLIPCPDLRWWNVPRGESIPLPKQREILARMREYLNGRGLKSNIDLPSKIEFQNEKCVWTDCPNPRVNNYAYCLEHLDVSTLES